MDTLPTEILLREICNSNEVFCKLRGAYPRFARHCEANKVSYLNIRARLRVFPAHTEDCAGCFYCYKKSLLPFDNCKYWFRLDYDRNRYIEDDGLQYDIDLITEKIGYNAIGNPMNILVPPVWKNSAKVWMIGDIIHRDYGFAILIKNKYYAQYRINKLLVNGEYNVESIYDDVYDDSALDKYQTYNAFDMNL
jgi:hypothetical protein